MLTILFRFIGLTPGLLVSFAFVRYLNNLFGSRRGRRNRKKQTQMIRVLRNIDRILSASPPSSDGELYYKDHGLLLCEVNVLRQGADKVFPRQIFREFLEEVDDLVDIRTGIERQMKVVERIRWAYSKWL